MQEQNFIGRMGDLIRVSSMISFYGVSLLQPTGANKDDCKLESSSYLTKTSLSFLFQTHLSYVVHHYFTETQPNYTKPNASPVDNRHQSSTARHSNINSLERGSNQLFLQPNISTKRELIIDNKNKQPSHQITSHLLRVDQGRERQEDHNTSNKYHYYT